MKDTPVQSLSDFVNRIHEIREEWNVPANKEIWFKRARVSGAKARLLLRPSVAELFRFVEIGLRLSIFALVTIRESPVCSKHGHYWGPT